MSKILLPLAQGFEEIELVTLADGLRRGGVQVSIAALGEELEVQGAHAIVLKAEEKLTEVCIQDFDGIVLHGGMEGVQNMLSTPLLLDYILQLHASKKLVGAICAAPLVLDQLQMLENDFCTYPGCERMMHHTKASRLDRPFSQDGHIMTATGPAFALPFVLELIRLLEGKERSEAVKKELLF